MPLVESLLKTAEGAKELVEDLRLGSVDGCCKWRCVHTLVGPEVEMALIDVRCLLTSPNT